MRLYSLLGLRGDGAKHPLPCSLPFPLSLPMSSHPSPFPTKFLPFTVTTFIFNLPFHFRLIFFTSNSTTFQWKNCCYNIMNRTLLFTSEEIVQKCWCKLFKKWKLEQFSLANLRKTPIFLTGCYIDFIKNLNFKSDTANTSSYEVLSTETTVEPSCFSLVDSAKLNF